MDPESRILLWRIIGLALAFVVLLWTLGALRMDGTL
jgi:hypothetical protein